MKADVVIPVSPDAGWSPLKGVISYEDFSVGARAKSCAEGRAQKLVRSSPLSESLWCRAFVDCPPVAGDCGDLLVPRRANRTLPLFSRANGARRKLKGAPSRDARPNALNARNP